MSSSFITQMVMPTNLLQFCPICSKNLLLVNTTRSIRNSNIAQRFEVRLRSRTASTVFKPLQHTFIYKGNRCARKFPLRGTSVAHYGGSFKSNLCCVSRVSFKPCCLEHPLHFRPR